VYNAFVLTPAAARARILAALEDVAPLPPERVPLAAALGRALAEDLVAEADLPAFDASTMDGYALHAADAPRAGTRLPVALEVFAGPRGAARPGAAADLHRRAHAGGADAVEMQEEVRRTGAAR
jgi:molybdopterin molybdotransferase